MKLHAGPIALATVFFLLACTQRDGSIKQNGQGPGVSDGGAEAKGLDPRAAFETSGLLGGMTALPESPVVLISGSGNPEAGVALSLGGALSTAAIARRRGADHELVIASGARAALPGPVLAMAASGERIAVACIEPGAAVLGSIACFKTEGEGEGIAHAWAREGPPVRQLMAVPGGRFVAADEASRLYRLDAATGTEDLGEAPPVPRRRHRLRPRPRPRRSPSRACWPSTSRPAPSSGARR